ADSLIHLMRLDTASLAKESLPETGYREAVRSAGRPRPCVAIGNWLSRPKGDANARSDRMILLPCPLVGGVLSVVGAKVKSHSRGRLCHRCFLFLAFTQDDCGPRHALP